MSFMNDNVELVWLSRSADWPTFFACIDESHGHLIPFSLSSAHCFNDFYIRK